MSFDALAWAARQYTGSSGTKLVLMGLAECASRKDALAFPSVAELIEFSALNRKSVITNLDKLESLGFIADTGDRVGRTRQVKVYRICLERVPQMELFQKRNGSGFSRKSPKNGTRNKSEPVGSEAKASKPKQPEKFIRPDDIPKEPWIDFVQMRARIGKPMTERAKELAVIRLRKLRDEDGWPPGDVLNHSTLNSYQGLFPPASRDRHERPSNPTAIAFQRVAGAFGTHG